MMSIRQALRRIIDTSHRLAAEVASGIDRMADMITAYDLRRATLTQNEGRMLAGLRRHGYSFDLGRWRRYAEVLAESRPYHRDEITAVGSVLAWRGWSQGQIESACESIVGHAQAMNITPAYMARESPRQSYGSCPADDRPDQPATE